MRPYAVLEVAFWCARATLAALEFKSLLTGVSFVRRSSCLVTDCTRMIFEIAKSF